MKLPLPKRLARVDEIARRTVQVVPENTPPPTPAPRPEAPCGACDVPRDVHGIRYAHEVGHHEWIRTEKFRTPKQIGDPR